MNDSKSFWAVFIDAATVVSMLILFSKTMEVMGAISPLTLFGQMGLSLLYGGVVAAMIEGVILAITFVPEFRGNNAANAYKWFLFIVSAFCQFMDKTIVIDQMNNQSAYAQFFVNLTYGIPVFIALGLIIVASQNSKQAATHKAPSRWKGVRNIVGELMNGSGQDLPLVQNALDGKRVKLGDETNPTNGRGKK